MTDAGAGARATGFLPPPLDPPRLRPRIPLVLLGLDTPGRIVVSSAV